MKTYVLMVSRVFPVYHPRKGQNTDFEYKILKAVLKSKYSTFDPKPHTIRSNYALWEARIREINEGKAVLSLRYWTGKPYKTKQKEFLQLGKGQAGIQKLDPDVMGWFIDGFDSDVTIHDLAKNDGLSSADFRAWFKKSLGKYTGPMAIIHFTPFRYKNSSTL